ncbi:MAG: efflux RND transporter periplasmic adaptor subunit [Pseudomonadota bacterium]
MRGRYAALSILMLGAGLAGGVALERLYLAPPGAEGGGGPEILYWVAPMDANFRRDGPGKSPMGMDLVPVYEGQDAGGDPEEVRLSPAEVNAIGVRTAVARVEAISPTLETVGFVAYDDHATSHVHLRTEGWIERLNVRSVGDLVREGDVLFELYAPEITVASQELLRGVQRGSRADVEAASRKLRHYGATADQIAQMAAADAPAETLRVHAPQDGVVIALEAADGMFLRPETRAMSLTDLSTVWLIVDVFERDIGRLTEDWTALARFDSLPGQAFEGAIDYIYPALDATTRTLPVRLRFDNSEGLLRPGMFASVTLASDATREAVTVPAEAVIRTGRAERVILRGPGGAFRPRLVTTGLTDGFGAGGRTEIVQGLAPGDEVVASAQFLIDSESALSAGLTRMAPTEGAPAPGAGTLLALDPARRQALVRHEAIPALGWPAMETRFALRADLALGRLAPGDAVRFAAARGADGLLALVELRGDDGVAATGTGRITAVTADGKLTLSHDPIPALGWPAMVMDMPVAGFDPQAAPRDAPVEFDLAKGEDGLYVVTGVRAADAPSADTEATAAEATAASRPDAAPAIVVPARIEAVDPAARTARIAHGPIAEIGMPGMTMDFELVPGLDPGALPLGEDGAATFARPDGLTMVLEGFAPEMQVEGVVDAVDAAARTATVTHGPMAQIGMPGMTMEFALAPGLDPAALPVGRDVTLSFRREPDFSLTLTGAEPGLDEEASLGAAAPRTEVTQ